MSPAEFVALVNGISVLINVLQVSVASVKDMLKQAGGTDQELNAILDAVEKDRVARLAARENIVASAQADGHPGE